MADDVTLNLDYYDPSGRLKWGCPIDVGHLILQLKTVDPKIRVGAVRFIEIDGIRQSRAEGVALSFERWDESGRLDFTLPGPLCIAVWASKRDATVPGLSDPQTTPAHHAGWCECLRSVLASIEEYPNGGGDIEIMAAIEKLLKKEPKGDRHEGKSL